MALEIGVGTGVVTEKMASRNFYTIGVDIDWNAILETKKRLTNLSLLDKVDLICCDGGAPFREGVFELIAFNPPYLPSNEIIDNTIDGGEEGISVIESILDNTLCLIRRDGRMLLLISSFSNYEEFMHNLKKKGYEPTIKKQKHIFFEDIYLIEVMVKRY